MPSAASVPQALFQPLTDAGGKVARYNGLQWYRLMHLDNRTHRELRIVDGKIGFIGGAGIADQWLTGAKGNPRWRDTMVRVEGEAVPNLQATFAENWLAAAGELLVGNAYFPAIDCPHPTAALVVNSTPTIGGSTRARVLMQLLLASARHSISITTPYFLPDKSLMHELCSAVERGVRVRILVPGRKSDHMLTRSTSRGGYGPLLNAGAEVYEYHPSMIHAKILCVDELWAVVGSTNFDNRSFGINDEVNLAMRNRHCAGWRPTTPPTCARAAASHSRSGVTARLQSAQPSCWAGSSSDNNDPYTALSHRHLQPAQVPGPRYPHRPRASSTSSWNSRPTSSASRRSSTLPGTHLRSSRTSARAS